MSSAEDIDAINDFMHRAEPRTAEARAAFNDWVRWYEDTKPGPLGWWSDADKDHASNLRNAYNRANAVTTQQKAATERVIKTGMSTEQMMGETDRRNADGNYDEHPAGAVHQWWFWPAVAAVTTAAVIVVGPKVTSIYLGGKL
jgi:hypothetical protein